MLTHSKFPRPHGPLALEGAEDVVTLRSAHVAEAAGSWLAQSINRENLIQFQNRQQLSRDGGQTIKKFGLPNNGGGDYSNDDTGDFGSPGPTRKVAAAAGARSGGGDMDDEIPF